ncbi:S8 family peptidase [Neobacillus terrae]|uniref:S8 family peptidase n=1 Tax=Neobacillus terrae TaxID=3034837 RepID=UPI00140D78F6|nr:S8 family peptidase [Neobacillus terrae]NHM33802.1 peptidase S8 [Neobacillus terrae]
MRIRTWIILFFILGGGAFAAASFRSMQQESPTPSPIYTNNQDGMRQMQVQNLQQGYNIMRVDSISDNRNLTMRLNSDPTIKVINHNKQDKSHYYDHEVIVEFEIMPSKTTLGYFLRDIDGIVKEKLDHTYIFKSKSQSPIEMVDYFKKQKNVSFVEPHFIYLKNDINDTYYFNYQWNLPAIGTEGGWKVTRGSKDVKIAVVDTGVDLTHPDLAHRLTKGYNAIENNNRADDDNGHGTHVAGIIASVTNNRKGVAGITWYNPIMPVKVLNSEGAGGSFDVAKGVRWAADHGADVINLSLGNYKNSAVMRDAINYALKKDVVIVCAAGNDNTNQPSYPAAYPGVVGVSAVDWNGRRADFSNYGNYVDVAAPGVEIASTFFNGQYASLSGTSMAAPHVTALAGLIRSVDPNLKNNEVANVITRTTQGAGQSGFDPYYGSGIINNAGALQYAYKRRYPMGRASEWVQKFLKR